MKNMFSKFAATGIVCGMLMVMNPFTSMAAIGPGFTPGAYVATITADSVNINKSQDGDEVLTTARSGDTYEVLEDLGNGWMKIRVNDGVGYLPVSGNAAVDKVASDKMAQVQKEARESSDSFKKQQAAKGRQQIANYALQFVGGRYKYGGADPRTGVDCSGFTRYVLKNAAGVDMNRSSGGQAQQGVPITADQLQPGDLLFYGSGKHISHVAMYIGNGRIVHASTEQTGIIVSNWNYRTPVKMMNVLGSV